MNMKRREFLRNLGISAAALPFINGLPSLASVTTAKRKQRLVIMFSPNGIVPTNFWPDEIGEEFTLKPILQPLEPLCQDIRADAGKVGTEIAEPLGTQHQFPHHQQRPALPDQVERMSRPAGIFVATAGRRFKLFSYFF